MGNIKDTTPTVYVEIVINSPKEFARNAERLKKFNPMVYVKIVISNLKGNAKIAEGLKKFKPTVYVKIVMEKPTSAKNKEEKAESNIIKKTKQYYQKNGGNITGPHSPLKRRKK